MKYKEELHKHYKINNYWSPGYVSQVGAHGINYPYPQENVNSPQEKINEKGLDTRLRSFAEIKGYHIQALGGKIGYVDDIIVDDLNWEIVYILVNTSSWLPWSKKVLISTRWMDDISYEAKEIKIDLHEESTKSAP